MASESDIPSRLNPASLAEPGDILSLGVGSMRLLSRVDHIIFDDIVDVIARRSLSTKKLRNAFFQAPGAPMIKV